MDMVYKLLLIFGDCITVLLVCFYGGVGILESGTAKHMLAMSLPCIALWLLLSYVLHVYAPVSGIKQAVETDISGRLWDRLTKRIELFLSAERIPRLIIAWGVTALLSVCWQSLYWQHILKSDWYFRISPGLLVWYGSASFVFLFVWRVCWSLLMLVIRAAKTCHPFRTFICVCLSLLLVYQILLIFVSRHYKDQRFTVDTVPADAPRTALVFGAGVYRDGTASKVLNDRVNTAVILYRKGVIDRMIMSGDNTDESRNEVNVMADLAMSQGVPAEAILRDNEGYSTRLSLHHVIEDFGETEVTLVSQRFHTLRILMLCERLGIRAAAVSADLSPYNHFSWMTYYIRDSFGVFLTLIGLYK